MKKVLQIKIDHEIYEMFEYIYQTERVKESKLTKKEVMEKIIKFYVQNHYIESNELAAPSSTSVNDEILLKLYEYVLLLVKANTNLPTKDEVAKMKKYVESPSRFDKFINEKIAKEVKN